MGKWKDRKDPTVIPLPKGSTIQQYTWESAALGLHQLHPKQVTSAGPPGLCQQRHLGQCLGCYLQTVRLIFPSHFVCLGGEHSVCHDQCDTHTEPAPRPLPRRRSRIRFNPAMCGWERGGESLQSLVELLFLSSFQMMKQSATRRTTVFQDMSVSTAAVRSLLPGLLSLSVGSQSSMLCLPSCEGSSVSLQSPCSHSLTAKRTEREAQIFLLEEAQIFLPGRADGLRLCWVDAG